MEKQVYLYALQILPEKEQAKVLHDGECPVGTTLKLTKNEIWDQRLGFIGSVNLRVDALEADGIKGMVETSLDEIYMPVSCDLIFREKPYLFERSDGMSSWQGVVLWLSRSPIDPAPLHSCFRKEKDGEYYLDNQNRLYQLTAAPEPVGEVNPWPDRSWNLFLTCQPETPSAAVEIQSGTEKKVPQQTKKRHSIMHRMTGNPVKDRILCFRDTLDMAKRPELAAATQAAADATRVYRENFVSEQLHKRWESEILVREGTSYATAMENRHLGRVAVLNFANPHYPGGGVEKGAKAQEECLCRSSNLYLCLNDPRVQEDYYLYNQKQTDHFFSDRVIYSRGITVFKDDESIPRLLPQEDWFQVDVITCAAPYLAKRKHTNRKALGELFKKRIRNILETAIDNGAEVLILGAFGCGAFKNPPEIVAKAFREVLEEQRYRGAFRRVVFAIKSTVGGDPFTVCPNIAAFELEFMGVSPELAKLRFTDAWDKAPGSDDVYLPGGRVRYRGSESRAYHDWRQKNPWFGKQFSILGDSISTLEGYNPRGYQLHYTGKTCQDTGVAEYGDTWWGKVIDFFGGELLVNNSWSGSRVTRPESREEQFPSACSDRRTGGLHIGNVKPDVILVYLGINDWANGIPLEPDGLTVDNADTCFALAYGMMLRKLRRNYPEAQIWCATLSQSYMRGNPRFRFPETFRGIHIRDYNRTITSVALASGCRVMDLYEQRIPYDAADGTHPTADGMDTLAMLVVRQLADEEGGALLDCELTHDVVDGICHRCGKHTGEPPQAVSALRLRFRATGETRSIHGELIQAGRSRECALRLDSPYVARQQATFLRHEGKWYLRDNGSTNGTYLNGTRLAPGLLCSLHQGDVISFAQKEEVEVLTS